MHLFKGLVGLAQSLHVWLILIILILEMVTWHHMTVIMSHNYHMTSHCNHMTMSHARSVTVPLVVQSHYLHTYLSFLFFDLPCALTLLLLLLI